MDTDRAPWTEEHRTVLMGLLLITVVMFVFGSVQIMRSIRAPFGAPTGSYKTAAQLQAEQDVALKQRDTDGDGLSDYDELNVYLTSPYLADTDSDGVPDGTEVAAGDDPNCPRGQTCTPGASQIGPGTTPLDISVPGTGAAPPVGSNFVGLTPEGLQNMDAAQVRALLRGAGIEEAVLAKYTDEQLLALFRETLAKNNPVAAASSTTP